MFSVKVDLTVDDSRNPPNPPLDWTTPEPTCSVDVQSTDGETVRSTPLMAKHGQLDESEGDAQGPMKHVLAVTSMPFFVLCERFLVCNAPARIIAMELSATMAEVMCLSQVPLEILENAPVSESAGVAVFLEIQKGLGEEPRKGFA